MHYGLSRWSRVALAGLALALAVPAAAAQPGGKDLTGKIGLGYTSELGMDMLSARYPLTRLMSIEADVGLRLDSFEVETVNPTTGRVEKSDESETYFGLAGKLFVNLVHEENLLFYVGGGLGVGSVPPDPGYGDPVTVVGLIGTLGVEYFIPWWPNLGLNLEVSAGILSESNGVSRTVVGIPLEAGQQALGHVGRFGFHYYFDAGLDL